MSWELKGDRKRGEKRTENFGLRDGERMKGYEKYYHNKGILSYKKGREDE